MRAPSAWIAAALACLLVAACESATGTPSATPAGTDGTDGTDGSQFESLRFPYRVELPPGWEPRNVEPGPSGNPGIDTFDSPDLASGIYVSSSRERLPDGTTPEQALERIHPPWEECAEAGAHEERDLGGDPALVVEYDCAGVRYVLAAITVHRDIGYLLFWDSRTGNAEPDRATFESVLDSLEFTD
ncbi:MAG: hypothetical protein ABR509_02660 [Candidatus Limnocylindria bacterium]